MIGYQDIRRVNGRGEAICLNGNYWKTVIRKHHYISICVRYIPISCKCIYIFPFNFSSFCLYCYTYVNRESTAEYWFGRQLLNSSLSSYGPCFQVQLWYIFLYAILFFSVHRTGDETISSVHRLSSHNWDKPNKTKRVNADKTSPAVLSSSQSLCNTSLPVCCHVVPHTQQFHAQQVDLTWRLAQENPGIRQVNVCFSFCKVNTCNTSCVSKK